MITSGIDRAHVHTVSRSDKIGAPGSEIKEVLVYRLVNQL